MHEPALGVGKKGISRGQLRGHEQAYRRARRDGESNSVTGRNRGSAANGRSVPRSDSCSAAKLAEPQGLTTLRS
jgi:hypothetical protein